MGIDYAAAKTGWPKQKAALTRALKMPHETEDEQIARAKKVQEVARKSVAEWNEWGAWPDDWSLFQRALDDVLPWHERRLLEDL